MTDLRAAKQSLLDLEERLLCRLTGRLPAEPGGDLGDQARVTIEREASAYDTERVRARILDVRAALARIAAGVYGDCERCGEPIGKKRIEAIPETPFCVACAEALERQARAAARSSGTPLDEEI